MKNLIKQHGAGLAFIMSGPGPLPFLSPPDDGGDNGNENQNDDTAGSGDDDQKGGGETAPDNYYPDELSEDLRGATNEQTIDKLLNRNTGLRTELGKAGEKVTDITSYEMTLSDRAKSAFNVQDDDPALNLFKEIALAGGYSKEQFSSIAKFFDAAVEKGLVPEPTDPATLFTELAPEGTKGSKDEIQAAGAGRITGALNLIKTLETNGKISAEIGKEMQLMTGSKAGVEALEFMMTNVQKNN